jgi:CheY-like chemotaxis protein
VPYCVVDVGNCELDHSAIRRMVEQNFDARVIQAHTWPDAQAVLGRDSADLVLVNRVLDRDGSDGLEIIRQLKSDPQTCDVPVMLVSNFPNFQQQAERLGAKPGFGKAQLESPATIDRLRQVLSPSDAR